jgi:hypothetical protein
MNGLIRAIGKQGHPRNRDSKRNFEKRDKAKPLETVEIPTHVNHSRLPKYTQSDGAKFQLLGLEICPYMRNITIDRVRSLVYGSCALPADYVPGQDIAACKTEGSYCPRHRVDPEGHPGCWHYNLIWGKRDLKPETESS